MKKHDEQCDERWKLFLRRHFGMSLVMAAGIAVATIVAVLVFLWIAADAQAAGFVPELLGEWTVGYCIAFALNLILWELVFVASWVLPLFLIVYFVWYKSLPAKERKDYKKSKRHKKSEEGGVSFLCWLIWLAIVWVSGMWNTPFQEWTFNNWIYSWLGACLWTLLIIGIPGVIYLIWVLSKK